MVGFFAVWAKDIMLLSSNNARKNFDFIMCVLYLVVLLCKGSVFMLGGQEMRWFLLVLLSVKRLPKGMDGMVFVLCWQFGTQKRHERFLVHTLRS